MPPILRRFPRWALPLILVIASACVLASPAVTPARPTAPPQQTPRPTPPAAGSPLQALLDSYIDPSGPGVVLLVDTPQGQHIATRGMADIAANRPVRPDDPFRIASATKMFVAVIALQLAEEGALDLDEPAAATLPPEVVERIANLDACTIRQLLNMTSGIYDYYESDAFWEAAYADPTHRWTAAELIEFAYDQPPYAAPGDGWHYSNTNYLLAQMILEQASGQSLGALIDERIAQPLGLNETYLEFYGSHPRGTIRAYELDEAKRWADITSFNDGLGLGDGGVISTAPELAIFIRALGQARLISADSLAQMQELVPDGDGGFYGLGLIGSKLSEGSFIGHDGAAGGFGSDVWYVPEQDTAIVILFGATELELEHSEAMIDSVLELYGFE